MLLRLSVKTLLIFSFLNLINASNVYKFDNVTTLPDRQSMVHLFEWKWSDIAKECEDFLQHWGYGAVQISPPNEHLIVRRDNDVPWWVRYQPVSYEIISRSGNEVEFKDMVDRCNRVGVRIIVDVVLNHMVGIGQKKGVNGVSSSGSSDFDGTAGVESFPGVPFTKEHTHDALCDHDIQGSDYQNSATDVRNCRLVGLIDLNQGHPYVKQKMQQYLNKLVAYGVAGFRFDASKHMWPSDIEGILDGVDPLREDIFGSNKYPIVMHEVIDRGGEAVKVTDYTIGIGRYINFNYGAAISAAAKSQSNWAGLLKLGPGYGYGNLDDFDVLNFIDNHDNQRDSNPYVVTYKDADKYRLAVSFMLAWSYGFPRVMSSYAFAVSDQGPPSTDGYSIKSPTFTDKQECSTDSGWVCEHRWTEIRQMAKFHSIVSGTAPSVLYTDGNNVIAFARDGKGYFALNGDNADKTLNVDTTLPQGDYCDVYRGDVNGGSCTGQKIHVDENGKASFNVPAKTVVAFHLGSKLSPPPSVQPVPSSWKSTMILLYQPTSPGQNVFIRGGTTQSGSCASGPDQQSSDNCAIKIAHATEAKFFNVEYQMWSQSDDYLDFEGVELRQGTHDGVAADGTPLIWTTNDDSKPEFNRYNNYGPNYWLVEVKMDCDKTYQGWFELKGFVTNGSGWEPNVSQNECSGNAGVGKHPISNSINHVAKCGSVNVFEWGTGSCIVNNF